MTSDVIRRIGVTCVAIALMAAVASGADAPISADAVDGAATEALVKKLGSDDFATREQAQAKLEAYSLSQTTHLQKLIDASTDPEIKSRLTEIVSRIEEFAAITPPKISLDVKDASISDVSAALSKAMGTRLSLTIMGVPFDGPRPERNDHFSLKALDQPFWEVIRQLSAQQPVWIDYQPPKLPPLKETQQLFVTHGLAVTAGEIARSQTAGFSVVFSAAFDPRINVLDLHDMQVEDARDDQGHLFSLVQEPVTEGIIRKRLMTSANQSQLYQTKTFNFTGTDAPGKTVTIKGSVKFLVEIARTSAEVAEAGKHLNEAIALGDSKVTIRALTRGADGKRSALQLEIVPSDSKVEAPPAPNVEITATGFSLKGNLSSTAGTRIIIDGEGSSGGISLGSAAPTKETTRVAVTDATGKTIADYALPRGLPVTSIHALTGDFTEPLKFSFSFPTKTREVSVPFEFKNLAIKQ